METVDENKRIWDATYDRSRAGEEWSDVKLQCIIEGSLVASTDQRLERCNVAVYDAGTNADAGATAHDGIHSEDAAQMHQCLAQALVCMAFRTRTPQQCHYLFAMLRFWANAGQPSEQAR